MFLHTAVKCFTTYCTTKTRNVVLCQMLHSPAIDDAADQLGNAQQQHSDTQQEEEDWNNGDASAECVISLRRRTKRGRKHCDCTQLVGQTPTLAQHAAAQKGAQKSNQSFAGGPDEITAGAEPRLRHICTRCAGNRCIRKANAVLRCACQKQIRPDQGTDDIVRRKTTRCCVRLTGTVSNALG